MVTDRAGRFVKSADARVALAFKRAFAIRKQRTGFCRNTKTMNKRPYVGVIFCFFNSGLYKTFYVFFGFKFFKNIPFCCFHLYFLRNFMRVFNIIFLTVFYAAAKQ